MDIHIDGDIIVYNAGFAADNDTTKDVSISLANTKNMVFNKIEFCKQIFNIKNVHVYLTSNDKSNFRFAVAETLPYKGNRLKSHKPVFYNEIRDYLVKKFDAQVITGKEADDELGIKLSQDPINNIVLSKDKDLRMVPGWHWEMGERMPYFVSDPGFLILENRRSKVELFGTGYAWYAAQLLMGDKADNIPGLTGYGVVKTWELLNRAKNTEELDSIVSREYDKMKVLDRLDEIRKLIWISRN